MITVVDYGVGNLGSIANMIKKLGFEFIISNNPKEIIRSSKLILPGVGSFDFGMRQLNNSGLRDSLDEAVLHLKVPISGICLGMQLMTESSEEGSLSGLGWIHAKTTIFNPNPGENMKIPHMGWARVNQKKISPVLKLLDLDSRFYFVHSYRVSCSNLSDVLLTAQHGSITFDAAFEHENILGFQFHPEKSHRFGMALLNAYLSEY